MEKTSNLENQISNNLKDLIDSQIKLDDKQVTKRSRARKIIDTQINTEKKIVASKFKNIGYEHQKKVRLN